VKAHAEARIATMIDQLDVELARHGGPWLLGETYSLLDPYALMLCRWTRGMARPARMLPHLGPYLQRVLARPAVRKVFEREALPQPWV
jgi:glutathione S-transferase